MTTEYYKGFARGTTTRTWTIKAVKWIGWQRFGVRVVSGRPSGGKTIRATEFPEAVRACFDMDEQNNISAFTSDDMISIFESYGAKISEYMPGAYRITFSVTTIIGGRKNPQAQERAKSMKRDYMGRWTKD